MTMQQMCEVISYAWKAIDVDLTPEEIFNYSPTGELFMVFSWFENAEQWLLEGR